MYGCSFAELQEIARKMPKRRYKKEEKKSFKTARAQTHILMHIPQSDICICVLDICIQNSICAK